MRRSARADDELVQGSRYCSQRMFQLNLVLDGRSSEAASIWLRTVSGALTSRLRFRWPRPGDAQRDGLATPDDFADVWTTYLSEVAERRHQRGPR